MFIKDFKISNSQILIQWLNKINMRTSSIFIRKDTLTLKKNLMIHLTWIIIQEISINSSNIMNTINRITYIKTWWIPISQRVTISKMIIEIITMKIVRIHQLNFISLCHQISRIIWITFKKINNRIKSITVIFMEMVKENKMETHQIQMIHLHQK